MVENGTETVNPRGPMPLDKKKLNVDAISTLRLLSYVHVYNNC